MEFTKNIEFNTNPTVDQDLTIKYSGFLSSSQEVYIVYGYGDSWENTNEIKMKNNENGFVVTIKLQNYDTFNFCFKNSNNEWDNNSYCNYITPITPAIENAQSFDIDSLINELLEPIINIEPIQEPQIELITEQEENFDLEFQLSNILSNLEESPVELVEYSTLNEILTATKIENSAELINNELFENTPEIDLEENNILFENTTEITSEHEKNSNDVVLIELFENEDSSNNTSETVNYSTQTVIDTQSTNETSLSESNTSLIVSSRKLNKFYLFRKRIKLAFYKAFVKLPKLLLGLDEEKE